ncbi:MAG: glycine cleavage system protein R [Candidatus Azotimanducaceae bacterium]
MAINLLLTFVGVDRPGIVQELSALVSAHEGNWLESKMSRMGGRFAGIALVELPAALTERFKAEISQVRELSVYLEESGVQRTDADTLNYTLNIVGLDRPGILQEVTTEMSQQSINVVDLETSVRAAPMSGDKMFFADAQVLVPSDVDLADLHDRLDSVANELGIDILLELSD